MKLNLGAGDKPIEGWVNIDLVPSHEMKVEGNWRQDDVTELYSIENGSVSEILASHLIEHIHPKKVPDVLDRWYEVLEPGGTIALEQPDVVKCCIQVLRQLVEAPDDEVLNVGMHGLYGESMEEGDYMGHLWGYTFDSLGKLLTEAGFKDLRETRPVMKPWGAGIRDFRIEGTK
jgi:predicted SAM-dependent methyltransferase